MNLDRNAQLEIQYQKDPVCKEIFDTLLLAGYFRIRLPTIKVFDKVLGGLAWFYFLTLLIPKKGALAALILILIYHIMMICL